MTTFIISVSYGLTLLLIWLIMFAYMAAFRRVSLKPQYRVSKIAWGIVICLFLMSAFAVTVLQFGLLMIGSEWLSTLAVSIRIAGLVAGMLGIALAIRFGGDTLDIVFETFKKLTRKLRMHSDVDQE
jgi:hypothetical protein